MKKIKVLGCMLLTMLGIIKHVRTVALPTPITFWSAAGPKLVYDPTQAQH